MAGDAPISGTVRQLKLADGYVLSCRHYRPIQFPPRAFVMSVHGIQSHSGWYDWSSSRLAEAGYEVFSLDRRGSGLNENGRGYSRDWTELSFDLLGSMLTLLPPRHETRRPVVLTSVSWGGKLAAGSLGCLFQWAEQVERRNKLLERLFLDKDSIRWRDQQEPLLENEDAKDVLGFDGIALLYPAIFTHFDPNAAKRCAVRTAHALGLGRKTVPIPLDDPALFTDDPQRQQFIRDDPLALRRVSLSFLNATLKLTKAAEQYPDLNPPPTFLALAGRDEIVDLPRTREWAARLPTETTRIVEYPDARHTLEFDACREQFVADLIDWIESLASDKSGGSSRLGPNSHRPRR